MPPPTGPRRLINSIPAALKEKIREMSADHMHEVTLVLKKQHTEDEVAMQEQMLMPRRKRRQQQQESNDEQRQKFHTHANHIKEVKEFLEKNDIEIVGVNPEMNSIRINGKHEILSSLFGVKLAHFLHEGLEVVGHEEEIEIPEELSELVDGVLGLNEIPFKRNDTSPAGGAELVEPGIVVNNTGSDYYGQLNSVGLSGNHWADLYNYPSDLNGRGQAIGIICLCSKDSSGAYKGGYQESDMDQFFSDIGIAKPEIIDVSVNGVTNSPGGSNDGEVTMDIQASGAAAPGAKIVAYFAPNSSDGMRAALEAAINDTTNNPSVISISFGTPEGDAGNTKADMDRIDDSLFKACQNDITVVVSAGNYGSTCNDEGLEVQFPSSSRWVLCCGGTNATLSDDYKNITDEVVWNKRWVWHYTDDTNDHLASGGGFSKYYDVSSYQKETLEDGNYTEGKRGIPDVAGCANPSDYGHYVHNQSVNGIVGGTSAVAPLWAALIARLNEKTGERGYVNPDIYEVYDLNSGAFNDISEGTNNISHDETDYVARTDGWDPCTGLGCPNGTEILNALERLEEEEEAEMTAETTG